MKPPRTGIAVMAKAPVGGLAKTRLIPVLGAQGAAELAQKLLQHAVEQAVAAQIGPVVLWVTPSATHPVFEQLQAQYQLTLKLQVEGDVGRRMAAVFDQAMLKQASPEQSVLAQAVTAHATTKPLPWLLMGTDLPAIDAEMLRLAAAALACHDAVFIPALDGGYGLVGLQKPQPALFDNINWSTSEVMQQTRKKLHAFGLRHAELPPIPDIDEPEDLQYLPADWGLGPVMPAD